MGCCGSSSDYNRPQQQMHQRAPARPPRQQVHRAQPSRPQQPPRPRQQKIDSERRRVQANAATQAANYGWAGQRQPQQKQKQQQQQRQGPPYYLAQQPQPQPQQKQAPYSHPQHQKQMLLQQARPSKVVAFPARPKPAYQAPALAISQRSRATPTTTPARYRDSPQRPHMGMPARVPVPAPAPAAAPMPVIRQQPARMQPMSTAVAAIGSSGHGRQLRDASGAAHHVQMVQAPRYPMPAAAAVVMGGQRPIVVNASASVFAAPQPQAAVFGNVNDRFEPQQLIRRDSNGVSEFGDDDDDSDFMSWRRHPVSPTLVSPRRQMSMRGAGLYNQGGMNYGQRVGAF